MKASPQFIGSAQDFIDYWKAKAKKSGAKCFAYSIDSDKFILFNAIEGRIVRFDKDTITDEDTKVTSECWVFHSFELRSMRPEEVSKMTWLDGQSHLSRLKIVATLKRSK